MCVLIIYVFFNPYGPYSVRRQCEVIADSTIMLTWPASFLHEIRALSDVVANYHVRGGKDTPLWEKLFTYLPMQIKFGQIKRCLPDYSFILFIAMVTICGIPSSSLGRFTLRPISNISMKPSSQMLLCSNYSCIDKLTQYAVAWVTVVAWVNTVNYLIYF
jgi:hypothetical protein